MAECIHRFLCECRRTFSRSSKSTSHQRTRPQVAQEWEQTSARKQETPNQSLNPAFIWMQIVNLCSVEQTEAYTNTHMISLCLHCNLAICAQYHQSSIVLKFFKNQLQIALTHWRTTVSSLTRISPLKSNFNYFYASDWTESVLDIYLRNHNKTVLAHSFQSFFR